MMNVHHIRYSPLTRWSIAFMAIHAAAQACFTPFLTIYFRQLGLTSPIIGFLLGIRILVGTSFGLFWRHFAGKFNKLKILLLCSVFAAILIRIGLSFIPPISSEFLLDYCADSNHSSSQKTDYNSAPGFEKFPLAKRSSPASQLSENSDTLDAPSFLYSRTLRHHEMLNVLILRKRRNEVNYQEDHYSKTSDSKSSSKSSSTVSVFVLTFVVVTFGEMFASSGIQVVRASLYHHLDDTENLSFFPAALTISSLSHGISAVLISGAVDQIPCIIFDNRSSMIVQFASSAFFLVLAIVLVMFLPIFQPHSLLHSANRVIKAGRFLFSDLHHVLLVSSCIVLGLSLSVANGFLFWHLQDLGGTEFSMGVYLFMESVSQSIVRFQSHWFMQRLGLFGVFSVCFLCLSVTYLYLGLIWNAWMALLVTPISGFTHVLFWQALSTSLEQTAPPGLFHPLFTHAESFSALGSVLGFFLVGFLGSVIRFKIVFVLFGTLAACWSGVSLAVRHFVPKKETTHYAQLFRSEGDSEDDSAMEDWLEKVLDEDEEF